MPIVHHFPVTAREMWLATWRTGLAHVPYRLRGGDGWPPAPPFRLGTADDPYFPLLAASVISPPAPPGPALHLWNIDDPAAASRLVAGAGALHVAFDLNIRRFRQFEGLLDFSVAPTRRRGLIALPPADADRIASSLWQQAWPDVALIADPSPELAERFGGPRPADGPLYAGLLRREPAMDFAEFCGVVEQCAWMLGFSVGPIGHLASTDDLTARLDADDIARADEPPRPARADAPSPEWLAAISPDTNALDWSGIAACDLRALLDFPHLKRLDVSRRWWLDTQTVSRLRSLTELVMFTCWVEDLEFLAPLHALRRLRLDVEPLRGWNTLARLPASLHHLDLARSTIADLTPLTRLPSLQILDLAYTAVRDLTPLAELPALTELDVTGCAIDDYAAVNAIDGLEVLIVAEGQIPAEAEARIGPAIASRIWRPD